MKPFARWVLVASLLAPNAAVAGGSTADAGRAEGERGLAAYEAERWTDALDHFRKADALFHAPTLVLFQARCQAKLGKLLAARGLYERLEAEPLPTSPSAAFRDAKSAARAELAALRGRLGTLRIRLASPAAGPVEVDGATVSIGTEGAIEVDPGPHVVSVTSASGARLVAHATVGEGASAEVAIDATNATDATASPQVGGARSPGWVGPGLAFALGGVALGVGLGTGAMSLSKTADIKSRCLGTRCLPADEAEGHAATTLATVSTVGFVVAALGLATGVTLVALRPRSSTAASASARVGPGFVELSGRF